MFRQTTMRAAAAIAVLGALALAGCGGGSSKSMLPLPANGATTQNNGATTAILSVTLPNHVGAQSANRFVALSSSRKPAFIDTTSQNSTIVVSVTPSDPAEAAQYGNLTVCYNLYTAGVLATSSTGFTVTPTVPGGNVASTVSLTIPAPPGTDGYQITQYAGQCGSPYAVPTAPPTITGSNILVQTPVTYAYIVPGATNNLNNQIANCPAQTIPCPQGVGAGPPATLAAAVTVAKIAFGAIPIASPVREQGAFTLASGKIGVPIPLEALDAGGSVIPGLTTVGNLTAGAGPFPSGVVVTSNDTTTHTALYLVDATNGAIAQVAGSNATGLTIHEFNALSGALSTGGNDITFGGSTAVAGDPWIIVMAYDGAGGTNALALVTVTATATIPPATVASTVTTTITPQSAVYTAGGTGYVDMAAPAAAVGLLQSGTSTYVSAGNKILIDGTATASVATGTSLGSMALATWPSNALSFVYALDYGQAGGTSATEVASGVYAFNPLTLAATPVSAQAGNNNYVQFANPVGVAQAAGTTAGHPYLYVVDKNGAIYQLDISNASEVAPIGGFQEATHVLPALTTSGTALKPGTATYLGSATLASGLFLIADPGNNRIAQVDATQNPAVITAYATGAPFTGLFLSGTAVYATSTSGQIYYISGPLATPVSMGFTTGTAVDGPIGTIASLMPAATPTLTAVNYPLQFQTGSFFDSANAFAGIAPYPPAGSATQLQAPYTVAPFGGTKAFGAVPAAGIGLRADTSAGGTTGAGKINATGGILVIAPSTAAAATVTPDSILFVDSAGTTGKVRTIVH